ncbi:MAG: sensor histidine kinase [Prevotellaceae bacterium]|nr:sensor histidine kinase [Prevotellaceae bacterium]
MKPIKRVKISEIFIHLGGWIILFSIPFFFMEKGQVGFQMNWGMYQHHCVTMVLFLVVFYINYFYLVPKLLFSPDKTSFFVINVGMIVAMGLLLQWWNMFDMPPPEVMHRRFHDHPHPPHRPTLVSRHLIFFVRDLMLLMLSIGFSVAIKMGLRFAELENARREADKVRMEAELSNLRNQLNPHFLLNTLNNIYALIDFNKNKAQKAVIDLSKLLRYVLYENQDTYVPLEREVEFLKNYIELMRIRLTDQVELTTGFSVPRGSQTKIAPLIFISLIENAFKHGVLPNASSVISVFIGETSEGVVVCDIRNSYSPKDGSDKSGSGIGLEQVHRRLDLLYPNAYSWETNLSLDSKIYTSVLTINTLQK